MVRSLLDGADLPLLRTLTASSPEAAVAAGVIDSGLLQFDADDAYWGDRDRVVGCGPAVLAALTARLESAGAQPELVVTPAALGGDAMALAFGAAMASELDGAGWRSWCVMDGAACDDGRVWEIARAASEAGADVLGVVVTGTPAPALWRACGWGVHLAPFDDPAWLLGALDQVVARAPAVVMVTGDE